MKRWLLLIAVVVALVVLIGGVKGYGAYKVFKTLGAHGPPRFTVSTTKAQYQDWLPQLGAVGSLRAERGADLSAEVGGIVDQIQFNSGDTVQAGQPLLRLRAADDLAHLESLRATAALAETNYQRDKAQLEAQAISQAVLDSDAATLRSARAQVAEQQALVAKKFVRAPFAGQIGIRAVDLGEYLAPGTKIATLQQLDPIFVDFSLPQQSLAQIHVGQKVQVIADVLPDKSFAGEITALDPQVDTDTRNVKVRARLKNPEHKLLPGMYANVSIEVGAPLRYLTLPQTAVAYNPYGATVYVVVPQSKEAGGNAAQPEERTPAAARGSDASSSVHSDLVAKQAFVTTGATRGDQVAILKGINEGDEVVTSGQIKLRNGALVTINNSAQPSDDANPQPQEH
ncbi:MAG: efflux RND transporter periplasmic adaptor subunit [Steroidobacteraceae bacterium]